MQVVDNLDLDDFFNNKGFVIIHFNKDSFEEQVSSLKFEDFKGKWLFCKYNDSWKSQTDENCTTVKSEIIYPNDIEFNRVKFDLVSYYEKINKIYEAYCAKYQDMPFPDIIILDTSLVNHHGSHLVFQRETHKHIIYIDYHDLGCVDIFSFTLGHELGHIVYMTNEKENSRNLVEKRFTILFPWEFAFAWLFVLVILFVSVDERTTITQFLFLSAIKFYITLYFLLSVLSFPRFLHYQNEFHSDRFALELDPSIDVSNIADIFSSRFNTYTHPCSKLRLHEIMSFGKSEYKNPIFKYWWSLRIANGLELRITLELLLRDIGRTINKYLYKMKNH